MALVWGGAAGYDGHCIHRDEPPAIKLKPRTRSSTVPSRGPPGQKDDIKALINDLIAKELSRNTVRNALCVVRGILNHAIEEGVVESATFESSDLH